MNRDDAIRKIQSCLNMARSGQASEAATALRQAQAMMARYGIDHPEILAAAANALWVTADAASRPARYESRLAAMVAGASGCVVIFTPHWTMGHWTFIGCSPGLDIDAYIAQHHPHLGQLRPTCRASRIDTTRDQLYGIRDGQTAELRGAVGTRAAPLPLGR